MAGKLFKSKLAIRWLRYIPLQELENYLQDRKVEDVFNKWNEKWVKECLELFNG